MNSKREQETAANYKLEIKQGTHVAMSGHVLHLIQ